MKRIIGAITLIIGVGAIAIGVRGENISLNIPDTGIGAIATNIHLRVNGKIPPNSLYCQVVPGSIYDGDTFRAICEDERKELKVRLCGIDAPEKDQALGIESRDTLRELMGIHSDLFLVVVDRDRYGRKVAEAFVPTGRGEEEIFINAEMIRRGMAWHYERYSNNCPNWDVFDQMVTEAKQKQLGIHAKSDSVPPWEWRKR
jgi:endonuclease YncB( thermonuclease family)